MDDEISAEKQRLQWHPAFYAGLQIEFKEEMEELIFENEHKIILSKEECFRRN